jgi:hypothetical protein
MLNDYLEEVMMQARQHDLERTLERRRQLRAAQAEQQRRSAFRFTLLSKVLIALGTQFIVWGQRLQLAHAPSIRH